MSSELFEDSIFKYELSYLKFACYSIRFGMVLGIQWWKLTLAMSMTAFSGSVIILKTTDTIPQECW